MCAICPRLLAPLDPRVWYRAPCGHAEKRILLLDSAGPSHPPPRLKSFHKSSLRPYNADSCDSKRRRRASENGRSRQQGGRRGVRRAPPCAGPGDAAGRRGRWQQQGCRGQRGRGDTSLISRLWTSPSPVEAPRVGSGNRQTRRTSRQQIAGFHVLAKVLCVFVCISCDDRNHPGAGGCGAWAVLSRFRTPDGTNAAARKRSSTLKCAMAIAVAVLAESIPRAEEMTLATTGGAA